MSEEKTVINTLLIKRVSDLKAWSEHISPPNAQSHPADLGNLMIWKCHEPEEVMERLEILYGLAGIEYVIVADGDTDWFTYMNWGEPDYDKGMPCIADDRKTLVYVERVQQEEK